MAHRSGPAPTLHGHSFDEAASAVQKCIRRGLEDDALYWSFQLLESGYGEYLWKRLTVITSEDVGLGEPHLPATIDALYNGFKRVAKTSQGRPTTSGRLMVTQAVILLCRAPKSRMVDHAVWLHGRMAHDPAYTRETPDFALDKHTRRGKQLGRSWDHFFTEGEVLANEADLDDPYAEPGRKLLRIKEGLETVEPSQPMLPVKDGE